MIMVAQHEVKLGAMKLALSKPICNVRVCVVSVKKKKRKYKRIMQSKRFSIFREGEEERPL